MNHFEKFDIRVFDRFIEKFAERYIDQRSDFACKIDEELLSKSESLGCDFKLDDLMKIIRQNSVAVDSKREGGKTPSVLNDIYRSDLGELLTSYYFEEKIEESRRFLIPIKNITYREKANMPGRGIDVIGYRKEDGKINVLLGEAKVSGEKKNPPAVVDQTKDSIYETQKTHHNNLAMVLERLADYLKRMSSSSEHFIPIAGVVLNMTRGKSDSYEFTYGCGLVRDYTCVNGDLDYGKMKSKADEFIPGTVDFVIFSFTEKTIDETVQLFYQKTMELVRG